MSTAVHSYGTTLGLDPLGGTSYTSIAELVSTSFPEISVTDVKRSNLSSPNAAHEYIAGFIDGGTVTFTCRWTKVQYALFMSNLRKNLMSWLITFPLVGAEVTHSTLAFSGHINKLPGDVPEDDVINNDSIGVKVSGLPVFTSGS